MSELRPRRENRPLSLLLVICQLLPLLVCIPLIIWGTQYLRQGHWDAGGMAWLSAVALLLVFFLKIFPQMRMDWRARRLLRHGLAAEGEIIHSAFSGTLINNQPQYRLEVRYVHPGTGQEHIAKTLLVADYAAVSSLNPGGHVSLRVSPDRPDHITIA